MSCPTQLKMKAHAGQDANPNANRQIMGIENLILPKAVLPAIRAYAIANKMDEEEIELGYEEEKQKCMDEYLNAIEAAKSREDAEKKYHDKLNKAINKYNMMMSQKLNNKNKGNIGLKGLISSIRRKIMPNKKK